ncbi:hypothetical protein [Aeromicrobium wangtongii]|uniref:Uncharacterized protein n=1 Tax=Aeromicrobium wangtongii TaxID=2969247 RepID=A0ABY5M5Y9_9ACTN|nr:hypothetical protein [Aeromicrobium wangtongii]MCD9198545.1 hypothetical protein [Aeromicrobium wangtongii]UUP12571.1 hypothetical protein NQV15_11975 [Aeromicrobium wangtongii]
MVQPKCPRWIWLPSLGGFFGVIALLVLHVLPESTHPYLAWAMALVPLAAMGVLAREWRHRRPVTAHELEYVRVGIGVLTLSGIAALSGGAIPLTLVAGPAFWFWTVADTRKGRRT